MLVVCSCSFHIIYKGFEVKISTHKDTESAEYCYLAHSLVMRAGCTLICTRRLILLELVQSHALPVGTNLNSAPARPGPPGSHGPSQSPMPGPPPRRARCRGSTGVPP